MKDSMPETSGYYGEHEEFETYEQEQDLENSCIECGCRANGRCGCCGMPLCSRHAETQAGFCSEFTTHSFSEGEVVEVVDGITGLVREEVKFLEDVELSGCLSRSEEPTEKDLFMPMDELPEDGNKPVSELEEAEYKVLE